MRLVLLTIALFAVANVVLSPEQLFVLYLIKLVQVGVVALVWSALASARPRPTVPMLLGIAAMCITTALSGVLSDDFATARTLFVMLAIVTSTLLPWGPAAQAIAVAAAAGSLLWNVLSVAGVAGLLDYGTVTAVLAFVMSIYLAHAFAQARAEIDQRAVALRGAEALAHLGSWQWDMRSNTVTWSEELYRIFGLGPGDFGATLEAFSERVYPEDRRRVDDALRATLDGGKPYDLELRIVRPDGSIRWLHTQGEMTREGGTPIRMIGSALDVTEQKRAQEALLESEEKFRTMIEMTPDLVSLNDMKTAQFVEVNRAWCDAIGLAREQAIGETAANLGLWASEEDLPRFLERLRGGAAGSFDLRFRRADGETRVGSSSLAVVHVGGRDAAMLWTRDVTEQRRGEQALRESEERFRSLASLAPIGIYRTDASGAVTYTSPPWQRMVGLTLEQSLGWGWAGALHPEDKDRVAEEWQRTVREGGDFAGDFRIKTPRGDLTWVHAVTRAVRSPSGELLGYVGALQDINERKAVEQMRADLVRMLSHDIKNPLSTILGFIDLLREDLAAGRDSGEALDAMESSAREAMTLALNFLEADRIETHNLELGKTPTSLNEIVRHEVQRQAARARMAKVTLDLDLGPSARMLDLDPALIGRAVANLLSNAIKFSPADGSVHVRTASYDGRAVVAVRDGGPGISDTDRERLFRRYGRGSAAAVDSTGLGLFIVKTIAVAHGGDVEVSRPPEGGSVFELWLPNEPSRAG